MSAATHSMQVNSNNSISSNSNKKQNGTLGAVVAGVVSGGVGSNTTNPGSATPVQVSNGNNMAPQQVSPPSQSSSPPTNNAPKYGTLVPNRVFVGGISANTTEGELAQLFSAYGTVKATKIISDRAGVSKGYGFVTFESEEEAKRLQRESDNIMLRERRLNIAPAIKKQPFNRSFDVPSPPPNAATQAQFYYAASAAAAAAAGGGVPYAAAYQNGMAYYATPPQSQGSAADPNAAGAQQPVYQAPPVYAAPSAAPPTAPYPMPMYPPQPLFIHQQYPYQPVPFDPQQYYGAGNGQGVAGAQYMYGGGSNGALGNGGGGGGPQQHLQQQQHHQQPQPQQSNNAAAGASALVNQMPASLGCGGNAPSPNHQHQQQQQQQQHHLHQQQHQHAQTPTYYHHYTTYNVADGMYYNVPMYTIDPSTGAFSEGIDPSFAGIVEASHSIGMEHSMSVGGAQAPATSITPPTGPPLPSTGAMPKHHHHHHHHQQQQHQPPPPPPQHHVNQQQSYVTTSYNCSNGYPPSPKLQSEKNTTPVVSLLAVGQDNERDYRSMQGGRKQRTDRPQDGAASNQPFRITGQPMTYMYQPINGYMQTKQYHNRSNKLDSKCESNQCRNTWSKKRRNYNNNCNTESSSMSSLRTSSNSSANAAVFDENLNEKNSTSPPTSYSPIHNNTDNARTVLQNYSTNQQQLPPAHLMNNNLAPIYYSSHGGGGGGGSRRNKRNNTRRGGLNNNSGGGYSHHVPINNTPVASQLHEVGAGDASNIANEVSDICKKTDSLKL